MNNKEYIYGIDKYTIGVDTNGEDGIGMTVAKIENGELHFLGNCYGENARCIDLLIKENQSLKKQLEENKDKINWYENFEINRTIDKLRIKHNNQQKEFIKYLEEEISKWHYNYDSNTYEYELEEPTAEDYANEILQKYKSIIGDDK